MGDKSFKVTSIQGTDDDATVTIEQVAVHVEGKPVVSKHPVGRTGVPMSEQLYRRIEVEAFDLLPSLPNGSEVSFRDGGEPIVVWVPVEPCVHGKIDRHQYSDNPWRPNPDTMVWCEGAGLGGSDE